MSKVRGQGYDGAFNMRGELNGLKQKILAENKCAFYIHCFAHQLQLVVVATSSEYAYVVDLLLNEMNERFTKANSELLTCIACLDPRDSFQTFYRDKLLQLAELYSDDFSGFDLGQLRIQLDRYISNMTSNEVFTGLHDIGELAKKMVQMKYHITYDLIYRLVELALVLPVATATVERSFSAMKFIKTDLHNKMGDNFLTDALVCYVEKDIFASVENKAILQRFQAMGPLRCQLPTIGKKSSFMESQNIQDLSSNESHGRDKRKSPPVAENAKKKPKTSTSKNTKTSKKSGTSKKA
ncbi:uncharacterized protein LOC143586397 [Bidens hawaiensis]|uniref:uncharacterized protein LOC143586397 n=1 Tax=Bidens hawaiensis TaxID=980011 RepID=UPI004049AD91